MVVTPNDNIPQKHTNVPVESPNYRKRVWQSFWHNPMGIMGMIGIIAIVLFTFVGPLFYTASAYQTHIQHLISPPSAIFPLGTDALGRNSLARLMLGGQLSLEVGFAAAIATMIIGVVYGLVAGIWGGKIDSVMMRIVDILLAIPSLFILLLLDSMFQPSAELLIVLLALTSWFGVSRLVRSEVLTVKKRDFVEATRSFGGSNWYIMWHQLLPNVTGTVMVATTFQIAGAILTLAGLSFLGLGLPPPTPNWGGMLSTSMNYMFQDSWWLIYPPGLVILITVLSINFIQEALQKAFDVRL